MGRIVIITGCPGTGKSTAAAQAASHSTLEKSVYLHTDTFYDALRKGAIPPWMPASDTQNRVVIEAFLAAARRFADGGYEVIVDGVVGPWMLAPWLQAAREGCEVHYIILRADREETLRRATERAKLDEETNTELVEVMWPQFEELGAYEGHVIDTTRLAAEETLQAVLGRIAAGDAVLA